MHSGISTHALASRVHSWRLGHRSCAHQYTVNIAFADAQTSGVCALLLMGDLIKDGDPRIDVLKDKASHQGYLQHWGLYSGTHVVVVDVEKFPPKTPGDGPLPTALVELVPQEPGPAGMAITMTIG